jgi:hypothetical protein
MLARQLQKSGVGFETDIQQAMTEAYHYACLVLGLANILDSCTEIVAKRIIEAAKAGERNPQRICDLALAGFKRDHSLITS